MNQNNLWVLLAIINLLSYGVMWWDKIAAIHQKQRTRELTLWFLCCIGGCYGIWLGMQAPIYHKAGKRVFRIGVPIFCLIWTLVMIGIIWI